MSKARAIYCEKEMKRAEIYAERFPSSRLYFEGLADYYKRERDEALAASKKDSTNG